MSAVLVFLLVSCEVRQKDEGGRVKDEEGPSALHSRDWPAFQGGGTLGGRAQPLPPGKLRLRWEYKIDRGGSSSAAIVAGVAYLGGGDGAVHAVDLATGELKWRRETGASFETTPLVRLDGLFIGDTSGVFHALSVADGRPLWTFETGERIVSSAHIPSVDDQERPGPAGGAIVFGSYDSHLYCLSAGDGKEVWRFQMGAQAHATPCVAEGLVLGGGCDAMLHAVDASTGQRKWDARMGAPVATGPVAFEGKVVAGNLEGKLACFSLADGTELWSREFEGESFFGLFAYSEGCLVAPGRNSALYCLDPGTGELKWKAANRAGFDASPVASGGQVYAPGKDGKLHVFDIATGEEVWSFPAGGELAAAPAIGGGVVIFCDSTGTVYCLEPAAREGTQ